MLDFEWDPVKAAINLEKHGVPFAYAARVFLDPHCLDREDTRQDYGEARWIALGMIEGRVFTVAYTRRRQGIRRRVIRLISARKANGKETKQYHTFFA